MPDTIQNLRREFIKTMLRPLVRFSLRGSHTLRDVVDEMKVVFVEIAREELEKSKEKVNVSRVSVMTGVHRKDVTKILKENKPPERANYHLMVRIVGRWQQDERFLTKSGKPKVLKFEGKDNLFHELVTSESTNLSPGTVLFELERTGTIVKTPKGIKLQRTLYRVGDDPRKRFLHMAKNVEGLILAAEENLFRQKTTRNLNLRTYYDNISLKDIPKIRKWLLDEGKSFHRKIRDYLAEYDKDINPKLEDKEAGATVLLGSYSFTVDSPEEQIVELME